MKLKKSYLFPLILICSVLLGSLIGLIFKEDATVLKPFGEIFLNLMYTLVVPLLYYIIINCQYGKYETIRTNFEISFCYFLYY